MGRGGADSISSYAGILIFVSKAARQDPAPQHRTAEGQLTLIRVGQPHSSLHGILTILCSLKGWVSPLQQTSGALAA